MSANTASVVICTLNRPDDIQRCVSSLARQNRTPLQIIIVDAGDLGSIEVKLHSACDAANIEFLYLKDAPSTTRQRNKGSEAVKGDVVFFLDDDVELDPGYIETILGIYDGDRRNIIGGVTGVQEDQVPSTSGFWRLFCRVFFLADTRVDVSPRMKPSNFPVHTTGLTQIRKCELMPSTAVSYRINVFRKYFFDRDLTGYVMAEDLDLAYRVSRDYQLMVVPGATYRHSKSPVSRNSVRESEMRRVLFTQYFFRKNLGGSARNWFARYWALCGMLIRYSYLAIRSGNADRVKGLVDGMRAAARNGILWPGRFVPGPLVH
ncbi:MAG TPA: glycosyltransferase [Woeseiaceae bacterium]|nr:glycosyltransferase [Woeseiaceae bacterium]